jgi:uncharacterized SAM-binding protein YcdF (DUF218 family)
VFWLKKSVSFFLMPLPFCLALLALGLLMGLSIRHARNGRRLAAAATILLLLFSNRFVSFLLVRPLETRYAAMPEVSQGQPVPAAIRDCRYVAVLGGGHTEMPGISATSQLSSASLARIVEAVRLLRVLPDARLIVSGPGEKGQPTHADVLARAAESLGIDTARITLIDTAMDTEDEAFAIARVASGSRIALVTSSSHMPRAAHLFKRAGANFVPCPADFAARRDIHLHLGSFGWDTESLERSTFAFHEWIGLLWLQLRGA